MTQPKDIEGLRKVAEEAIKRVTRYVRMRREKPMRGLDDRIHGVHFGTEWEAELTLSDVSALLEAVKGELANTKYVLEEIRAAHDVSVELHLAAEAALVSLKGGGGSSCTNLDGSPVGATDSQRQSEIEEAFDDAAKARDEAGFLGSPAECIRYLDAEVHALSARLEPDPSKPNLGLGHTVDCPHFEERFPWQCDCRTKAEGRS